MAKKQIKSSLKHSNEPKIYRTVKFKITKGGTIDTWLHSQRSAPASLTNIILMLVNKYGMCDWSLVVTKLAQQAFNNDTMTKIDNKGKSNNTKSSPSTIKTKGASDVTSPVNNSVNKVTHHKNDTSSKSNSSQNSVPNNKNAGNDTGNTGFTFSNK